MARLRGITAAGILVIGALVTSACGSDSEAGSLTPQAPADPTTATTTAEPTSATLEPTEQAEPTEAASSEASSGSSSLPSSGKGSTIVPVDAFEGALTLEDEGLSMTDDDSGRQLFTFKALGGDLYQVRGTDSSGENKPRCWRAPRADEITPSVIVSGACDTSKKNQQFTIVASGEGYVISRVGSGNLTVTGNGLEYDENKSTVFRIGS